RIEWLQIQMVTNRLAALLIFIVDGENSSIILYGVKTLAGKDDGNTGHLSPQHSLIIGSKGAAKIIIGSSVLTGSVGEPIIGIEKAKEKSISGLI
ncbi:hypothetical protein C210_32202, partial [Klebsiella pneumoniae subsp. pneumoniae KpMDU1]